MEGKTNMVYIECSHVNPSPAWWAMPGVGSVGRALSTLTRLGSEEKM